MSKAYALPGRSIKLTRTASVAFGLGRPGGTASSAKSKSRPRRRAEASRSTGPPGLRMATWPITSGGHEPNVLATMRCSKPPTSASVMRSNQFIESGTGRRLRTGCLNSYSESKSHAGPLAQREPQHPRLQGSIVARRQIDGEFGDADSAGIFQSFLDWILTRIGGPGGRRRGILDAIQRNQVFCGRNVFVSLGPLSCRRGRFGCRGPWNWCTTGTCGKAALFLASASGGPACCRPQRHSALRNARRSRVLPFRDQPVGPENSQQCPRAHRPAAEQHDERQPRFAPSSHRVVDEVSRKERRSRGPHRLSLRRARRRSASIHRQRAPPARPERSASQWELPCAVQAGG